MADETLPFVNDLKRLKYILISTGLSIKPSKNGRVGKIMKLCVFIFNFIWLNSDIIGAIFWIMDCVKSGADMTQITYLAPCATLSGVATVKSIYLILNGAYVEGLIAELATLDMEAMNIGVAVREKIVKEERRFLNFVINLLNVLNVGMVVNFTFGPLILIAIKYIRTNEVELILPFLDVYPFDPLDIRYWPLVYVKQIWSECIVLLEICAADYLYYICCTNIRIQFRLLAYEFEIMVPDNDRHGGQNYDTLRGRLIKLTKWHQSLINATNTLEVIYSKSTLFNFLSSSIIICLTGFNVTAIDNVAFAVTFLTFLFMSLLQIFFLCLFGDMIMRSSLGLSDAVYNSLWYAAGEKMGKDLLLVQTRAQKPCKLTALGFADVNLRAFTKAGHQVENQRLKTCKIFWSNLYQLVTRRVYWIISTAWSYFALLKTLYNSDQE